MGARRSTHGFTIMEMLIATGIMMTVTGAVFTLMNPTQGTYRRSRKCRTCSSGCASGADMLRRTSSWPAPAPTWATRRVRSITTFRPIMPYRVGDLNPDPAANVFYRSDTISLIYVPPTAAQTGVVKELGNGNSQEIDVEPELNCGIDKHTQLCGFQGPANARADLRRRWQLGHDHAHQCPGRSAAPAAQPASCPSAYDSGQAVITEVSAHTYYLKTDTNTNTYQLMHYDGTTQSTRPKNFSRPSSDELDSSASAAGLRQLRVPHTCSSPTTPNPQRFPAHSS